MLGGGGGGAYYEFHGDRRFQESRDASGYNEDVAGEGVRFSTALVYQCFAHSLSTHRPRTVHFADGMSSLLVSPYVNGVRSMVGLLLRAVVVGGGAQPLNQGRHHPDFLPPRWLPPTERVQTVVLFATQHGK